MAVSWLPGTALEAEPLFHTVDYVTVADVRSMEPLPEDADVAAAVGDGSVRGAASSSVEAAAAPRCRGEAPQAQR